MVAIHVPLWLSRTYYGLLSFERVVLTLRLFALVSVVAYSIAVLVAPKLLLLVYLYRINCDNVNVSNGLLEILRQSVAHETDLDGAELPVGPLLTKLEINILSQYAEAQVALAPQYIMLLLWRFCVGNYNITSMTDPKLGAHYWLRHNDMVTCEHENFFAFDYRRNLERVGLKAILAYAYNTPTYKDKAYLDSTASRKVLFDNVPRSIVAGLVLQAIVCVATVMVYSRQLALLIRKFRPGWVIHAIALVNLGLFIAFTVGIVIITKLVVEVSDAIDDNLGPFGLDTQMGQRWFALYWLAELHALLLVLLWAMPLWCANPDDDDDDDVLLYSMSTVPEMQQRRPLEPLVHDESLKHASRVLVTPLFRLRAFLVYDQQENELRKLGQSMSRKSLVRRFNSKGLRKQPMDPVDEGAVEEETRELLYQEASHHYPLVTYDGYTGGRSRTNTLEEVSERSESPQFLQPRVLSNPARQLAAPTFVITPDEDDRK